MKLALLILGILCLSACDPNMGLSSQRSFKQYERPKELQGRVLTPSGSAPYEPKPAQTEGPLKVDLALLIEGQKYYSITCTPCHGELGRADGEVLSHGFVHKPISFVANGLEALPVSAIYQIVTDGGGYMLGASDQLNEQQRWAVAHYVKALQQLPKELNCGH